MSPASACCLRSCRRRPIRSTSLAICRPFSVCRGRRQRKFFSQRLGQLRTTDAHAFTCFDLGTQPRDRPVGTVGHGRFQQRRDHPQGRFALHRRRARRDPRLQGFDAAGDESAAPEAGRVFPYPECLGDLRTGPARQRQQHGPRPIRLPTVARARKSQKSGALRLARSNRRLSRHDTHPRISANSESQRPSVRWSTNRKLLSRFRGSVADTNPTNCAATLTGIGS